MDYSLLTSFTGIFIELNHFISIIYCVMFKIKNTVKRLKTKILKDLLVTTNHKETSSLNLLIDFYNYGLFFHRIFHRYYFKICINLNYFISIIYCVIYKSYQHFPGEEVTIVV